MPANSASPRAVTGEESGRSFNWRYWLGELKADARQQLRDLLDEGAAIGELLIFIFVRCQNLSEIQTAGLLQLPTHRVAELHRSMTVRLNLLESRQAHERAISGQAGRIRGEKPKRYTCPSCQHACSLTSADPLVCPECCTPLRRRSCARPKVNRSRRAASLASRRAA